MFTLASKGGVRGYRFEVWGLFIIIDTSLHTRSPAEMFVNRLEVDFIDVKDSVKLDANHMVVVYKQEEGKIERRIVQGPTIFVPNAHEW